MIVCHAQVCEHKNIHSPAKGFILVYPRGPESSMHMTSFIIPAGQLAADKRLVQAHQDFSLFCRCCIICLMPLPILATPSGD